MKALDDVFRTFPELDVLRVKGGYVERGAETEHVLSIHALYDGVVMVFLGRGATLDQAAEDVAQRIVRRLRREPEPPTPDDVPF